MTTDTVTTTICSWCETRNEESPARCCSPANSIADLAEMAQGAADAAFRMRADARKGGKGSRQAQTRAWIARERMIAFLEAIQIVEYGEVAFGWATTARKYGVDDYGKPS